MMVYARSLRLLFLGICVLILAGCSDVQLTNLQVEYTETPLGIDVEKPRFSWQMMSDKRGQEQTAYQITVRNEEGKEMWTSGKTDSGVSLNIVYEGASLQPMTRYTWSVKVWGQSDETYTQESWFETGLMNPSISAWDGAQWIGGEDEDLVLYPSYLPVYTIHYTIQLDEESGSTKAGLVYGSNDPRLMDKNRNLYNLENERDESFVQVDLDISPIESGGNALLTFYRVGYAPSDKKDIPLSSIEIPSNLLNNENKYDKHRIRLKTMYSQTECYLVDDDNEAQLLGTVVVNPLGNSWDYICFPLLCEVGFAVQPSQKAAFSDVEIRNYREPANVLFTERLEQADYDGVFASYLESAPGHFKIDRRAYVIDGADAGFFMSADMQKKSTPLLRTAFTAEKKNVAKARLYITARGIYEAYLNGEKVSDDYFNPGLTQYNKTHLYQTYDVTEYIRSGENVLGVAMAEGWWSGAITYMGYLWNLFGDRQSVLTKLVITYEDGSEEKILSDPNTWSYFDNGPVMYSSFFQGEVYDAQKETLIAKWSEPGYDASEWTKVVLHQQEKAITHDPRIEEGRMPAVNDFSSLKLEGQFGKTVKKVDELTAISMEEVRPGVYVYDMGQNMVGVPKISLNGIQPGTEVRLRFAEVTYPDLPEFADNVGMIMLENIRGALAQDIYIAKGGKETIHPRFTFHGYRFIEITGIDKALPLSAVKGDVLSSIHTFASSYETSNPKVNKLWENITWSTRGNFLSIPTDCPQRNERMGWSGDISVFSRTATYMANVPQFLRRHMLAMRDTQREDGRFADVAPVGGGFGGILWGSAGITVAWESYLQYHDIRLLEEHYDAMVAYIDYLRSYIDPSTDILTEGNLGDWLGPEQEKNDNTLLWEAYFIYDLNLMHRMATLLDKKEDASSFLQLYEERKAFFNKTYFEPETGKAIHSGFNQPERKGERIETQTSYIIALAFDICTPELKKRVVQNLLEKITNETMVDAQKTYAPYSLMTGFIGTAWINRVLSDLGHSDKAYRILQQTSYPSWLYSIEQGATTIWERLNSYTEESGFSGNNSMNSFNHYSFGSVGSWMYNYSLGIERDEKYPGFKRFILRPQPDFDGEMTTAKGHYDSMYGRIESSWTLSERYCEYSFSVPANTQATLYLYAESLEDVTEGGKPITETVGVDFEREDYETLVFNLSSGDYLFKVKR